MKNYFLVEDKLLKQNLRMCKTLEAEMLISHLRAVKRIGSREVHCVKIGELVEVRQSSLHTERA